MYNLQNSGIKEWKNTNKSHCWFLYKPVRALFVYFQHFLNERMIFSFDKASVEIRELPAAKTMKDFFGDIW